KRLLQAVRHRCPLAQVEIGRENREPGHEDRLLGGGGVLANRVEGLGNGALRSAFGQGGWPFRLVYCPDLGVSPAEDEKPKDQPLTQVPPRESLVHEEFLPVFQCASMGPICLVSFICLRQL